MEAPKVECSSLGARIGRGAALTIDNYKSDQGKTGHKFLIVRQKDTVTSLYARISMLVRAVADDYVRRPTQPRGLFGTQPGCRVGSS
jgi:hypothetical protein